MLTYEQKCGIIKLQKRTNVSRTVKLTTECKRKGEKLMNSKTTRIKETLTNGCSTAWREAKPLIRAFLIALLSMGQRLIEFYEDAIDEVTEEVEERVFSEHPRISRIFAHVLFWSAIGCGIVVVDLANSTRLWFLALNKEQINALINLVFVVVVGYFAFIILLTGVLKSIVENGFIKTVLEIAVLFLAVKGLSLIFAWTLTLNFGVETPSLDTLVYRAAMLPETVINMINHQLIPWIMENYHILFNK